MWTSESLPSEVDLEYDDLCTSFLRDIEEKIKEKFQKIRVKMVTSRFQQPQNS
jgi:hypothetical protein